MLTYWRFKNNRLAAGSIWAMSALSASPGAKRHNQTRRERGDVNRQPEHLFNKFLGQLHHCPHTGASYDENHAFPPLLG